MSDKKETFPNLTFSVDADSSILLEQIQNHESVQISLHPQQLAHIGRALFSGRSAKDAQIADLQRKITVLTDRIGDLVGDKLFRTQIIDRCGDWEVILARWDHIFELACEFDCGLVSKAQLDADEAAEKGALSGLALPSPRA